MWKIMHILIGKYIILILSEQANLKAFRLSKCGKATGVFKKINERNNNNIRIELRRNDEDNI